MEFTNTCTLCLKIVSGHSSVCYITTLIIGDAGEETARRAHLLFNWGRFFLCPWHYLTETISKKMEIGKKSQTFKYTGSGSLKIFCETILRHNVCL